MDEDNGGSLLTVVNWQVGIQEERLRLVAVNVESFSVFHVLNTGDLVAWESWFFPAFPSADMRYEETEQFGKV